MTTWTEPRRVPDDTGSHIEPPLDAAWSDIDKLAWHAGVATFDTGLPVSIHAGGYYVDGVEQPGYYTVRVGNGSTGPFPFDEAWTFINGVIRGAQELATRADGSALGDALRALASDPAYSIMGTALKARAVEADRLEYDRAKFEGHMIAATRMNQAAVDQRNEARARVERLLSRLDSLAANYEVNADVNAREPRWADIAADLRRAVRDSGAGL